MPFSCLRSRTHPGLHERTRPTRGVLAQPMPKACTVAFGDCYSLMLVYRIIRSSCASKWCISQKPDRRPLQVLRGAWWKIGLFVIFLTSALRLLVRAITSTRTCPDPSPRPALAPSPRKVYVPPSSAALPPVLGALPSLGVLPRKHLLLFTPPRRERSRPAG